MTFYEFQSIYKDDNACLERLMQTRYGGTHINCPKCDVKAKFYKMTRERAYVCQYCKHQLHPTVGTIMERSRTPLHKWFFAIFLFSTSRHGVAAKELERQLGVTYKCAWRMAHLIRNKMAEVDGENPLDGIVEVDETYVGGKRRGQGRGYKKNKTIVFGMAERGGDVMTKVVPNVQRKTLQPIIQQNVLVGSEIHTDELPTYSRLPDAGYRHESVNHSHREYVRGHCHVNSIESFWARLKLSIRGTHVHVSRKHLWKYLKEFEYRWNRRKQKEQILSDLLAAL